MILFIVSDFQLLLGILRYINLIFFNPTKQNTTTKKKRKSLHIFPFFPLNPSLLCFCTIFHDINIGDLMKSMSWRKEDASDFPRLSFDEYHSAVIPSLEELRVIASSLHPCWLHPLLSDTQLISYQLPVVSYHNQCHCLETFIYELLLLLCHAILSFCAISISLYLT